MTTTISLNETDLKKLVIEELQKKLGDVSFQTDDVQILVKSKQNYKAEWEPAWFKATVTVDSPLT